MTGIDLADLNPDDQVIIQDQSGNVAGGFVTAENDHGVPILSIRAFGLSVPFARQTKTGSWKLRPGLRLVGHTPILFGGAR